MPGLGVPEGDDVARGPLAVGAGEVLTTPDGEPEEQARQESMTTRTARPGPFMRCLTHARVAWFRRSTSRWRAGVDSNHLPPRYLALSVVLPIGKAERQAGCHVACRQVPKVIRPDRAQLERMIETGKVAALETGFTWMIPIRESERLEVLTRRP